MAKKFLQFVDEERLVLASMVADMADELVLFLRFWDTESYDPSEVAQRIDAFRFKVFHMFARGFCIQSGHTAFMLQALEQRIRTIIFNDGTLKSIGGAAVPAEIVERCMAGALGSAFWGPRPQGSPSARVLWCRAPRVRGS